MANTAVTTMRVGGQNVATPGARSQVKQVSEQAPALASNGVLAIVGPARNGAPQAIHEFDKLEGAQQYFSLVDLDGNIGLRLAVEKACDASDDDAIDGSPARLVLVKTNRDTNGTATVYGGSGALFGVASKDYGAHVNKTNIAVAAGTQAGVRITIKDGLGGTPEIGDNLGGDMVASVKYEGEADTATVTIDADGFRAAWAKAFVGLNGASSEVKNGWSAGTIYCKSSSVKDTYQRVTVYGLDGSNVPISATFVLNGTTVVNPTTSFTKLTGAKMDGAHVGTVKVSASGGDSFDTDAFITFAANATDALSAAATIKVQSNSGTDQGKQVEIVGYDTTASIAQGTGLISEIVTLGAADTPVTTARTFLKVLRVRWLSSADPVGTVVVFPTGGSSGSPHLTIDDTHLSPGFNHVRGIHVVQSLPQAGVVELASVSPSGTVALVLRGKNASGEDVAEFLSTAAQETDSALTVLEHVELGAVATTVTVTLSGLMLDLPETETIEDLVTVAAQFSEFTLLGFNIARKISELDQLDAVSIAATLGLYSSAWDVIDWINDTSELLTATAAESPSGLPTVTAAPVYLVGGTTAATTVQDYLDALDLLKTVNDINHVVVLTTDVAVHAALRDHCDWVYNNTPGGRQGYVGLAATTKTAIKGQTVLLNENILSWVQNVPRRDSSGVLRTYNAIMGAVQIAGMKASCAVGEPLTWKYLKTDGDISQTGWEPALDSEEMLRSGLCFAENIKGRGVRIVRSITCYQKKADANRTELSCWESLLACKTDLTIYLAETTTGKRRSRLKDKTVAQLANKRLDEQVTAEMIEGHTFPQVALIANGQGKAVSVGVTPEQPNNFTLLTLNI